MRTTTLTAVTLDDGNSAERDIVLLAMMRVNGVRLHVEPAIGAGEPLILVHGGWTDHTTWGLVAGLLARRFRVFRYDRRGHSRSERGPGPAPRRQDEDDLAALLEHTGPAHLLGTSYGASIALGLAGRRPELVRSVVAHEPPLLDLAPEPELSALIDSVQDQIAAGDAVAATHRFFESIAPGAWERIPQPAQRAAIGNAQAFLDLRADPACTTLDAPAVARADLPILLTYGDAGPPWFARIAIAVAEQIGRPSRGIPGAGHTPHHTHPDALVGIVEDVTAAARLSAYAA